MNKRIIYVGSLAEGFTECQLRDLFAPYGQVTRTQIIRHKYSDKSAGYGFIEMASGEEALRAVIALEGTELAGRCLRLYVTPLRPLHRSCRPNDRCPDETAQSRPSDGIS